MLIRVMNLDSSNGVHHLLYWLKLGKTDLEKDF